jgi:hypothetical protein
MSDPKSDPYIALWAALVGAAVSSLAGFMAVIIRARIEKKSEINYIKIAFNDELSDICDIIDKLAETCRTTHKIPNSYLNDLNGNNSSFLYHKSRLFLIGDEKIRKSITGFYKDLNVIIQESINTVGTLGDDNATNDKVSANLATIKQRAEQLKSDIRKYRYKVIWII